MHGLSTKYQNWIFLCTPEIIQCLVQSTNLPEKLTRTDFMDSLGVYLSRMFIADIHSSFDSFLLDHEIFIQFSI